MWNRKSPRRCKPSRALRDFFSATLICFLGSTKCLNVNSSGGNSDDYLKKSFFEPYLKIELGWLYWRISVGAIPKRKKFNWCIFYWARSWIAWTQAKAAKISEFYGWFFCYYKYTKILTCCPIVRHRTNLLYRHR